MNDTSPRPRRERWELPLVRPAAALLPLRLFLGLTFVYGGIQKLSDPGFLRPGAPSFIGTQLHGFASGTPGGFILRAFAIPQPKLAGIGVALVEIAVGLLVTAGLLTRIAAAAGLALNGLLFLTASWNTSPYFLGSDIVFVFAWLPFVLAGSAGQPSLDRAMGHLDGQRREVLARSARRRAGGSTVAAGAEHLTRRAALARALAATGVGTLVIAGVSALARGRYRGTTASTRGFGGGERAAGTPAPSPAPRHARHHASAARRREPPLPARAVKLGRADRLPAGQAAPYRDPGDGSADVVIRQSDGSLTALSAVCTHAGCACVYQQRQLVCPCHGSVFSAETGAVLQGPATTPLPRKRVIERGGLIYAVPS